MLIWNPHHRIITILIDNNMVISIGGNRRFGGPRKCCLEPLQAVPLQESGIELFASRQTR